MSSTCAAGDSDAVSASTGASDSIPASSMSGSVVVAGLRGGRRGRLAARCQRGRVDRGPRRGLGGRADDPDVFERRGGVDRLQRRVGQLRPAERVAATEQPARLAGAGLGRRAQVEHVLGRGDLGRGGHDGGRCRARPVGSLPGCGCAIELGWCGGVGALHPDIATLGCRCLLDLRGNNLGFVSALVLDFELDRGVELPDTDPRHERQVGVARHGQLGLELLDGDLGLARHAPRRLVGGQLGLGQHHGHLPRGLVDRATHHLVGREQPLARCPQLLEVLARRLAPLGQVGQHPLAHDLGFLDLVPGACLGLLELGGGGAAQLGRGRLGVGADGGGLGVGLGQPQLGQGVGVGAHPLGVLVGRGADARGIGVGVDADAVGRGLGLFAGPRRVLVGLGALQCRLLAGGLALLGHLGLGGLAPHVELLLDAAPQVGHERLAGGAGGLGLLLGEPPDLGALGLGPGPDVGRVVGRLAGQAGDALLGLLADLGRRVACRLQHPGGLLAEHLRHLGHVELRRVRPPGRGLGLDQAPLELGVLQLQHAHAFGHLHQVDAHLVGIPAAEGGAERAGRDGIDVEGWRGRGAVGRSRHLRQCYERAGGPIGMLRDPRRAVPPPPRTRSGRPCGRVTRPSSAPWRGGAAGRPGRRRGWSP